MSGAGADPQGKPQAWFYYALARLAVARNLIVAAAIAVMCVAVAGLALWALQAKPAPDPTASASLPGPLPAPGEDSRYITVQIDENTVVRMVDPQKYPQLYEPVQFTYKCGHAGSFVPADSPLSAYEPERYKAELELKLCPACQAQAEYRARQAAESQNRGSKGDAPT